MRTLLRIACALAIAAGFACDASEETDGEPCSVDDDCSRKQSCLRTDAERGLGLPGVCSTKSDCIHGQQLGCACTPEVYEADCIIPALPLYEGYPEMECDATTLVCVVPTVDEEETEEG
jgi:hypothetical protein